jgi:nicotinate-nucleotide--dimethylbenzimidazole phosphoribosyltransferase
MEADQILNQLLTQVKPLNEGTMLECKKRWDSIAKPLSSLGQLEDAIIQLAGITSTNQVILHKKALVIMCADNGVVKEGVTQTSSDVTAVVAENFLEGKSCACIMAQKCGVDVFPVDIGIAKDTKVPNYKVGYGTKNIAQEPAMTREEALRAIQCGINIATELKQKGYDIIATGEMGIGNTTTSSAIASVLLGVPVETVTGKGAGLSQHGLEHKIEVIKQAIKVNQPNPNDPIDVLQKVGGYDIAGMLGIYIGGAIAQLPVIIDGFISSVAALLAIRLNPLIRNYILPSHVSNETAGKLMLDAIGVKPYLTCGMCLGEGTGAIALLPLLELGLEVYQQMSTFEQIEIEAYQPL